VCVCVCACVRACARPAGAEGVCAQHGRAGDQRAHALMGHLYAAAVPATRACCAPAHVLHLPRRRVRRRRRRPVGASGALQRSAPSCMPLRASTVLCSSRASLRTGGPRKRIASAEAFGVRASPRSLEASAAPAGPLAVEPEARCARDNLSRLCPPAASVTAARWVAHCRLSDARAQHSRRRVV
jgi:hypothetical protein